MAQSASDPVWSSWSCMDDDAATKNLWDAVEKNNVKGVIAAMDCNANPVDKRPVDTSPIPIFPLWIAAQLGYEECVVAMLVGVYDANCQELVDVGPGNSSVVWQAARHGMMTVFDALIAAGVDIDPLVLKPNGTASVIAAAVEGGHKELLALLYSREYPERHWIQSDASGKTLLHLAAVQGDLDILNTVLDALNAEGKSSFLDAVTHSGQSALWAAAFGGHVHIVQRLIDAGAHPDLCSNHGIRPAQVAYQIHGPGRLVDLLLSHSRSLLHALKGCATFDAETVNRAWEHHFWLLRQRIEPFLRHVTAEYFTTLWRIREDKLTFMPPEGSASKQARVPGKEVIRLGEEVLNFLDILDKMPTEIQLRVVGAAAGELCVNNSSNTNAVGIGGVERTLVTLGFSDSIFRDVVHTRASTWASESPPPSSLLLLYRRRTTFTGNRIYDASVRFRVIIVHLLERAFGNLDALFTGKPPHSAGPAFYAMLRALKRELQHILDLGFVRELMSQNQQITVEEKIWKWYTENLLPLQESNTDLFRKLCENEFLDAIKSAVADVVNVPSVTGIAIGGIPNVLTGAFNVSFPVPREILPLVSDTKVVSVTISSSSGENSSRENISSEVRNCYEMYGLFHVSGFIEQTGEYDIAIDMRTPQGPARLRQRILAVESEEEDKTLCVHITWNTPRVENFSSRIT